MKDCFVSCVIVDYKARMYINLEQIFSMECELFGTEELPWGAFCDVLDQYECGYAQYGLFSSKIINRLCLNL
jgi:hypothetical protein